MEQSNPYATPDSDVAIAMPTDHFEDTPWYSPSGRLGRARYFLRSVGYYFLFILATAVAGFIVATINPELVAAATVPLSLAYLIIALSQSIKRLHDLNWSGWWLLLMFIPLVNFIFGLVLLFKPGTQGPNDYGAPAYPARNALVMVAVVVLLLFGLGIIAAISIPAYQEYITRIQAQ